MAISRAQMKSQLKGNKVAYERKHSSPIVEAIGKFVRKRKATKDSAKARKANEKKVAMQRTIRSAEAKRKKSISRGMAPPSIRSTGDDAKDLNIIRMGKGGKTKSRVNEAGNYTKPGMRKRLFNRIKAGGKGGAPGQWSARKAQMLAQAYKKAGGGYKN